MMNAATPVAVRARKAAQTRALALSASSSPIQVSKRSPRMYSASALSACTPRKSRNCSIASGALSSKCTSETKSRAMDLMRWGVRRRRCSRCRRGWGGGSRRARHGCRGAAAYFFNLLDDDGLQRRVGFEGTHAAGRHRTDAIDDIHPLHHVPEDGVTPAGRYRIQVGIVRDIDVELGIARVRAVAAGKSHGAALVLQTVAGFVDNGIVAGLQLHVARGMSAALDDKIAHDAMNERVGVVALAHVAQKVRDRERRALRCQLDDELTHVGGYPHPRRVSGKGRSDVYNEHCRGKRAP